MSRARTRLTRRCRSSKLRRTVVYAFALPTFAIGYAMNLAGKITQLQAFPISCPIPQASQVTLGIGTAGQARRRHRQGQHRRRSRRLGRIASRPRTRHGGASGRNHPQAARARHGRRRRGRRVEQDLRQATRQPRHGRGQRPRDERHRSGAVGHPRQGGRLAALPPAGRLAQSRCRLMRAALSLGYQEPAALVEEVRPLVEARLQGGEAARRRYARSAISRACARCARRSATTS